MYQSAIAAELGLQSTNLLHLLVQSDISLCMHLDTSFVSCLPVPPVAAGTDDGYIILWDFETRSMAKVLPGHRCVWATQA